MVCKVLANIKGVHANHLIPITFFFFKYFCFLVCTLPFKRFVIDPAVLYSLRELSIRMVLGLLFFNIFFLNMLQVVVVWGP